MKQDFLNQLKSRDNVLAEKRGFRSGRVRGDRFPVEVEVAVNMLEDLQKDIGLHHTQVVVTLDGGRRNNKKTRETKKNAGIYTSAHTRDTFGAVDTLMQIRREDGEIARVNLRYFFNNCGRGER